MRILGRFATTLMLGAVVFVTLAQTPQAPAQMLVLSGGRSISGDSDFLWSGVLSTNRATDWTTPGRGAFDGVLPARTTICTTLNPGASIANINTAINNCPSGQTVFLNAGTYNLSGMLSWGSNNNNVTLRGAGADQTLLVFSGSGTCNGEGASICVSAGYLDQDNPANSTTWTAGYTPGTTVITVASAASMAVGRIIALDQLDDGSDGGGIYVCSEMGECADEGGNSGGRANRSQMHLAKVVAVNGTQVTIDPPLVMPNWRSGQSPGVFWDAGDAIIEGVGIENLTVNATSATNRAGIVFMQVSDSWARGVRVMNADRAHIWLYKSMQMTVRDNYFYGGQGSHSESYGVEGFYTSWNLIENNIFNFVTGPIKHNGAETGSVIAYNFSIDDNYTAEGDAPQWMIPTIGFHESGVSHLLHEGNDGLGYLHDLIHGTTHFNTAFRNHFYGDVWNDPAKSDNTAIINIAAFGRYFNIVGNVLGRTGYYNTYQTLLSFGDTSVYNLGWPWDPGEITDARVAQTMFRWGNYDTVTDTSRFESSEVPTNDAFYPIAVPSSQALPESFYLADGPPSFWATPWGTPPWPPIGPDVTGGDVSGWDGHANKIPARLCYENTTSTVGDILDFNADDCYGYAGEDLEVDFWQDFDFTSLTPTNLNTNDHTSLGSWAPNDDPEGQLSTATACEMTGSGTINGSADSGTRGMALTPPDPSDNTAINYDFEDDLTDVSFGFWYKFPAGFLGTDDEHDIIVFENNSGSREYFIKHTDYEPGDGDMFLWTDVQDESAPIPIAGLAGDQLWVTGLVEVGGTYRLRVYDEDGNQIGTEQTRVGHATAPTYRAVLGTAIGALQGHAGTLCFDDFVMDWTDATFPLGPPL